ncbi:MAG TPA: pantoate--beta-alanine ligase [Bacteroidales bacterium]|nr:pantoate--beta-alanine ligase [Bacteroidales bacterium]
MLTCFTRDQLHQALEVYHRQGKSVGFVPTMGALHEGHLELIRRAGRENEVVVVSIFVNPIQFNNREDYEKYPRVAETDATLLREVGCDVLFAPDEKEMYPEPVNERYHFGSLETVMEGAFRPGHFNGVAVVVRRLFELVKPTKAYFGEKDYQQLAIIRALVEGYKIPVDIIPCSTVREADGLAMSSRNMRLNEAERALAPKIYQVLSKAAGLRNVLSPEEMRSWAKSELKKVPEFNTEYVEVADASSLQPIKHWNEAVSARIFTAVHLGPVRLIDNVPIF